MDKENMTECKADRLKVPEDVKDKARVFKGLMKGNSLIHWTLK